MARIPPRRQAPRTAAKRTVTKLLTSASLTIATMSNRATLLAMQSSRARLQTKKAMLQLTARRTTPSREISKSVATTINAVITNLATTMASVLDRKTMFAQEATAEEEA